MLLSCSQLFPSNKLVLQIKQPEYPSNMRLFSWAIHDESKQWDLWKTSCSRLFPSNKLTFTQMDEPPAAPKGPVPVPSAPVAHLNTYLLTHSHECLSTMFSYNVLFDLIHIFSWTGTTSAVSGPTVPSACGFAVEAAAGVASCIATHITAIHSPQRHSFKSHSISAWDFECHDLISCNGCMNLHKHALNQALKATCRLSNPSNSSIWCLCMSLYVAKAC